MDKEAIMEGYNLMIENELRRSGERLVDNISRKKGHAAWLVTQDPDKRVPNWQRKPVDYQDAPFEGNQSLMPYEAMLAVVNNPEIDKETFLQILRRGLSDKRFRTQHLDQMTEEEFSAWKGFIQNTGINNNKSWGDNALFILSILDIDPVKIAQKCLSEDEIAKLKNIDNLLEAASKMETIDELIIALNDPLVYRIMVYAHYGWRKSYPNPDLEISEITGGPVFNHYSRLDPQIIDQVETLKGELKSIGINPEDNTFSNITAKVESILKSANQSDATPEQTFTLMILIAKLVNNSKYFYTDKIIILQIESLANNLVKRIAADANGALVDGILEAHRRGDQEG